MLAVFDAYGKGGNYPCRICPPPSPKKNRKSPLGPLLVQTFLCIAVSHFAHNSLHPGANLPRRAHAMKTSFTRFFQTDRHGHWSSHEPKARPFIARLKWKWKGWRQVKIQLNALALAFWLLLSHLRCRRIYGAQVTTMRSFLLYYGLPI